MRDVRINGIGFWSVGAESWTQACEGVLDSARWRDVVGSRPAPTMMPANERRRAPESVLLAMAVAEQACIAGGVDPRAIPSVFASMYGDLSINDYMCATLASDPAALSPTKFHNSVHNAPSGYWSIATGSTQPTTAIAGFQETFAAGLLEAVMQLGETGGPVLLVAYDIGGSGPMAEFAQSNQPFGCALLLDQVEAGAGVRMHVEIRPASDTSSEPLHAGLAAIARANPTAHGAAALLETLANGIPADLRLHLSPALDLVVSVRP